MGQDSRWCGAHEDAFPVSSHLPLSFPFNYLLGCGGIFAPAHPNDRVASISRVQANPPWIVSRTYSVFLSPFLARPLSACLFSAQLSCPPGHWLRLRRWRRCVHECGAHTRPSLSAVDPPSEVSGPLPPSFFLDGPLLPRHGHSSSAHALCFGAILRSLLIPGHRFRSSCAAPMFQDGCAALCPTWYLCLGRPLHARALPAPRTARSWRGVSVAPSLVLFSDISRVSG